MTMMKTSGACSEHVFVKRDSLVTQYLSDKNFKAIHTMLVCVLLVLMVCNVTNYLLDPSIFWHDFDTVIYFIPGVHVCIAVWFCLHVALIGFVLPVTQAHVSSGFRCRAAYITAMMLTFVLMLAVPFFLVFQHNIYLLSCAVLLIEQVRLLMKMFSFVVENVKKQKRSSSFPPSDDNGNQGKDVDSIESASEPAVPTLQSFLYFLVAPTLIYRDEYPGAKRDLVRAVGLLFEMIIHVFAIAMILKFTAAKFKDIGLKPLPMTVLFDGFFASCVCSLTFVTGMTYGLWHQYENMWSEVLAFGDRQFYGPWWREKDLGKKIRFMNMIVSDFLFQYIYRPARLFGANRVFASYAVVAVSGIFHEYILWISFRFLLPTITMSMVASIIVTQIGDYLFRGNKSMAMIVHYFVFSAVNSLVAFGYIIEYYSRKNCPSTSESLVDYFVPRMFNCLTFE